MSKAVGKFVLVICLVLGLTLGQAMASEQGHGAKGGKTAIVIASFGTTVPEGLPGITDIVAGVRAAYPGTEVRLTFTSNIIRSVWKKRQAEAQKWLDQGVPEEVLYAKNIISTLGDLVEDGYSNIIVQPTHMFYMEQSYDLTQYIKALASIQTIKERWQPFTNLVLGRPALGMPGDRHDYHEDIEAVVSALAGDVEAAKQQGAILLYMGHGNAHWSTGIYGEVQKRMREQYPEVVSAIAVVEGWPSLDDVLPLLEHAKNRKILLKPFMIVAGDHASNDMAGEEEDSWKSILAKAGYSVTPELQGLGSNKGLVQIFVDHIRDAAQESGLTLE
jgi:sirohydrochlorin cobaltochelatase